MAPVQAIILPVTDRAHDFAQLVARQLRQEDLRVEVDLRHEKLGLKIREAQLQKIPYMLIVGDREVAAQTLSVRHLDGREEKNIPWQEFAHRLKAEGRLPRLS